MSVKSDQVYLYVYSSRCTQSSSQTICTAMDVWIITSPWHCSMVTNQASECPKWDDHGVKVSLGDKHSSYTTLDCTQVQFIPPSRLSPPSVRAVGNSTGYHGRASFKNFSLGDMVTISSKNKNRNTPPPHVAMLLNYSKTEITKQPNDGVSRLRNVEMLV